MPEFVIDCTVSVRIDAEDFKAADRVATELEHRYMEAAAPRQARFWTKIEEEEPRPQKLLEWAERGAS